MEAWAPVSGCQLTDLNCGLNEAAERPLKQKALVKASRPDTFVMQTQHMNIQ